MRPGPPGPGAAGASRPPPGDQVLLTSYNMGSILYGLQQTRYLMELTIFGATGATGTSLTEQALAAGHQVTAVVRDPTRLSVPGSPGLRVITADLMDPAAIGPAVAGAGGGFAAVGPRGPAAPPPRRDGTPSGI